MSCMQAANTKPMREKDTNTRWGLMGWGFVLRSMPPSIWMLRYSGTDIVIRSVLKKVKMWAVCTRRRPHRKKPAAASAGSRIWMCLPILRSRWNTIPRCSNGRRLSMPGCCLYSATRWGKALKPRSFVMKTALQTMSESWPVKKRLPAFSTGRRSAAAGTGRTILSTR